MEKNEFLRERPKAGGNDQLLATLNKLGAFTIIFLGMWLSTQAAAKQFNYDPAIIGYPFYIIEEPPVSHIPYPVYLPWQYFTWLLQEYTHRELYATFRRALAPLVICGAFAVTLYTVLTYLRGALQKQENTFGTARWGTDRDLRKTGLLGRNGGIILGQLFKAVVISKLNIKTNFEILHLKKPSDVIVQSGIYNVLLAAPTRSGKGVSSVIPTLLYYPGSLIVLDFKGENFNLTSGFRKRFSKIYRWAPVGEGHHFNPLMEIRGGRDAFSDADLIADILTTPSGGKGKDSANSEHFRTAAKELLTAVILHVLCSDYPDKSLPGCAAFLKQVNPENHADTKYICELMINSRHCSEIIHRHVVEGAGNQLKRPDNEGGSVLSTANNALTIFSDDHIRENSVDSDFYLEGFEKTGEPISLYLTVPNSDRDRIAPLIRMFIILLSRKFSSGETAATDRKLKVPLLFVLDEFDKLGKYDELHTNMGIHNGYGIHYFLIIQSLNQLNDIYGKDHSFLAHCRNKVIFAPGEIDSAKQVSEICGKDSILKRNVSNSGSRFSMGLDNLSVSGQEQERNLINADEVMKLPPTQLLMIESGHPTYIGKKVVYYEDDRFKDRAKIPAAFTDRQGALQQLTHQGIAERDLWFMNTDYQLPTEEEEKKEASDKYKTFFEAVNPAGKDTATKQDMPSGDDENIETYEVENDFGL
ncbi:conjugal transfer protein TraG [Spirochaetia bacterium]|nr:conjugal transfer protein TraG [Spirochaetia bacterium]